MTTSTAVKKDTQKLQRAIVDGLEDVKAQDIVVFDTEHLSALFERVIVASGTSNRQTKALAASVRDAVRDAGFPKPRVEGEVNGEWIIVDCGQAVVHIMQPSFRQYYHLEELWGDKPVRLKLGAVKPVVAQASKPGKAVAPKAEVSLKRSNAAKKGVQEAFPSKAQLKKAEAAKAPAAKRTSTKKTVTKSSAVKAPATKVAVKTIVVKAPVKTAAKSAVKSPARKTPAKKTASRKA
jgi:ribosome-associated protein